MNDSGQTVSHRSVINMHVKVVFVSACKNNSDGTIQNYIPSYISFVVMVFVMNTDMFQYSFIFSKTFNHTVFSCLWMSLFVVQVVVMNTERFGAYDFSGKAELVVLF